MRGRTGDESRVRGEEHASVQPGQGVQDRGQALAGRRCSAGGGSWRRRTARPTVTGESTGESATRSDVRSSTSVMTSPTSTLRSARPSRARWSIATWVGARHRSAEWSVSTRLCSSGIRRLNERRPASRWASRRCSLVGDDRRRQGRVGVAVHQDPVGPVLLEHGLEGDHHLPGLGAVVGRADRQVDVGGRDLELVEEALRHVVVVVLAGVDDDVLDAGLAAAAAIGASLTNCGRAPTTLRTFTSAALPSTCAAALRSSTYCSSPESLIQRPSSPCRRADDRHGRPSRPGGPARRRRSRGRATSLVTTLPAATSGPRRRW